jgi:hypothetical protein
MFSETIASKVHAALAVWCVGTDFIDWIRRRRRCLPPSSPAFELHLRLRFSFACELPHCNHECCARCCMVAWIVTEATTVRDAPSE